MRGGRGGRLIVVALAVAVTGGLLGACGGSGEEDGPVVAVTTTVAPGAGAGGDGGPAEVSAQQVDPTEALRKAGQKAQGGPVGAVQFEDANGTNLVVLSQTSEEKPSKSADGNSDYVHVYTDQFVTSGGTTRSLRKVQDGIDDCTVDNSVAFTSDKAEVSDLDGDGVGEVLFGYTVGCAGDISPTELKILVLEGGDKYIMRGDSYTSTGLGKEALGRLPVGKPDPAWASWPKGTQALAERHWDQWAIRE